jgi:hypothetical protein
MGFKPFAVGGLPLGGPSAFVPIVGGLGVCASVRAARVGVAVVPLFGGCHGWRSLLWRVHVKIMLPSVRILKICGVGGFVDSVGGGFVYAAWAFGASDVVGGGGWWWG